MLKQNQKNKDFQKSILGKRKFQQRGKRAVLVNATENDILKEQIKDMKIMIEKGLLDEDYKKQSYLHFEDIKSGSHAIDHGLTSNKGD